MAALIGDRESAARAAVTPFVAVGQARAERGAGEGLEWLLDGVLPVGGLSMLIGKPESGKSTLAGAMIEAIAERGRCFGRATRQSRVLYLALENPTRRRNVFVPTPGDLAAASGPLAGRWAKPLVGGR